MNQSLEYLSDILWKKESLKKICNQYVYKFIEEEDNENRINTLLYGSSRFLTRLIARKHVLKEETYIKKSNVNEEFYSHPKFIEFNEVDHKTIINIFKSLCMTKTILNRKQIIIIHDLPKSVQVSINKLIEKFTNNVYVILTFSSISQVCPNIKSSFCLINCNYVNNKNLIKQLYESQSKDEFVLSIKDTDIVNIAYQIKFTDKGNKCTDNINLFIIASIKSLIKNYNSEKYFNLIKEISYKCTGSVISFETIIPIILQYMIKNKYDIFKIYEYLELSCIIEHQVIQSNKIVFSFEYFFQMVSNILKTKI